MEMGGCRTLSLLGVEGLVDGHEEHINAAEPAVFDYWVDLNYRFCNDPCLWGAASHLLYIGEKVARIGL